MQRSILITAITFCAFCLFSFVQKSPSKSGKDLFEENCGACHKPTKLATARPFQKIREYRGNTWVYNFIRNPYAFALVDTNAKQVLSQGFASVAFPYMTDEEIELICDYVDSFPFDSNTYSFRRY